MDRLEQARDPRTPAEILRELAKSQYWIVRHKVAINPHTPAKVLVRLAGNKDASSSVLKEKARLPRATPTTSRYRPPGGYWKNANRD